MVAGGTAAAAGASEIKRNDSHPVAQQSERGQQPAYCIVVVADIPPYINMHGVTAAARDGYDFGVLAL